MSYPVLISGPGGLVPFPERSVVGVLGFLA